MPSLHSRDTESGQRSRDNKKIIKKCTAQCLIIARATKEPTSVAGGSASHPDLQLSMRQHSPGEGTMEIELKGEEALGSSCGERSPDKESSMRRELGTLEDETVGDKFGRLDRGKTHGEEVCHVNNFDFYSIR